MNSSVLIARIASLVYLSAGLGAILQPGSYEKIVDDMFGNAALVYLAGFMAIVLGSLMRHVHPVWRKDWTVLITLIGWLATIKGVALIAAPQLIQRLSASMFAGGGFAVFPYAAIALGLFFGFFGFIRKSSRAA